jgi:hypothetical protein
MAMVNNDGSIDVKFRNWQLFNARMMNKVVRAIHRERNLQRKLELRKLRGVEDAN